MGLEPLPNSLSVAGYPGSILSPTKPSGRAPSFTAHLAGIHFIFPACCCLSVITSYSIHYTKLYENGATRGYGRIERNCLSSQCSTLRKKDSHDAGRCQTRYARIFLPDADHPDVEENQGVITSYSIHYTKLYEMLIFFMGIWASLDGGDAGGQL